MVKVISLSNEAYSALKVRKKGKESFSDVVLKLSRTEKKGDIREVLGVWKGDKEIALIFDKILKERHEFKPIKI